jgi:hypothetical protein
LTTQILPEDFVQLALRLRETVVTHGVPAQHRASLIEDVVFQFATFLDERMGSRLHESVFSLLDDRASDLGAEPAPDSVLVAQLEIDFGKGRKALNILSGHLRDKQGLRETVEFSLGVRRLEELDAEVDIEGRFAELLRRKSGIRALRFNPAASLGNPAWTAVALDGSPYGTFEPSIEALCACIRRVARQWA